MTKTESPIHAYPNELTSKYVLRVAADNSTRTPKVYTATGVIMKKEGTDRDKEYDGNNYKYSIWAYHKLPYAQHAQKDLQQSDNSSVELTNLEDTENIQNSLLYTSYTDISYKLGEVVIVNKKGNHVEIVGTTGKLRDLSNLPVLTEDLCEIELGVVKKRIHVDVNGHIIPTPPPRPQDISSVQAPAEAAQTYEVDEISIESSTNCSDNYLTSVRDSIKHQDLVEKNLDSTKVYKGFDNGPKHPKPVIARVLKKGRSRGKYQAYHNDITVPVRMENQLRKLAADYFRFAKKKLMVISVFRTHEDQLRLYKKKLVDEQAGKTATTTALPGTSKHQSGIAIDFQIAFPGDGDKYDSNRDFKHSDFTEGLPDGSSWPKVFKFLYENASKYDFVHPDFAQRKGSFEGWHWEFVG